MMALQLVQEKQILWNLPVRGGCWKAETHPTPNQGTGCLGSQGCPLTLPLSRLKITGQIGLS